MAEQRSVKSALVKGIEKRYRPTKHYVFIIQVSWTDRSEYIIYRKYSQVYKLHTALVDTFPIEAGIINEDERVIPALPGRKLLGRSEVKQVATERQIHLAEYLDTLIKLPTKISQHHLIPNFFRAKPSDINPPSNVCVKPQGLTSLLKNALITYLEQSSDIIEEDKISISDPMTLEVYRVIADYRAEEKSEVSLAAGQHVDVVEKNESGWWFVQTSCGQGWAPASYLEPKDQAQERDEPHPDYSGELFMVIGSYKAEIDDEVSLTEGSTVQVLHKLLDGWWVISYNGEVGYAPATYLTHYRNPHLSTIREELEDVIDKRIVRKPTQRRCTIKATSSKWKSRPQRDLTLYRELSSRRTFRRHVTSIMAPVFPEQRQLNNEESIYEGEDLCPQVVSSTVDKESKASQKDRDSGEDYENIIEKEITDSYEVIDEQRVQGPVFPPLFHQHIKSDRVFGAPSGGKFPDSSLQNNVMDPHNLGDLPAEHAPCSPASNIHDGNPIHRSNTPDDHYQMEYVLPAGTSFHPDCMNSPEMGLNDILSTLNNALSNGKPNVVNNHLETQLEKNLQQTCMAPVLAELQKQFSACMVTDHS